MLRYQEEVRCLPVFCFIHRAQESALVRQLFISVMMFLNALSVLVESKVDISMKDRLLFSAKAPVLSGTCGTGHSCYP